MTPRAAGEQPAEQRQQQPQLRGEALREHILWSAKDVFLETGYETASMDVVAAKAQTSKRSLYAHFESKEKLFFAVLDLVRRLYLDLLKTPDAYARTSTSTGPAIDDPAEAVAMFCGRQLQLMVWESQVRTCRLTIASVERLPGSSNAYFDAIFTTAYERLADFIAGHYVIERPDAANLARDLLDRTVLPRFIRAVLGVEEPIKDVPEETIAQDVDLDAIRRVTSSALPAPKAR
ncbi:MAG: TetR/AcrR family transcriptional regulator [Actinocrinis sp.]